MKVPAGVEEGARILYSRRGEAGVYGGPPGDLYVVLHVKEHAFFEREGKDLHCVVPISFTQAALGRRSGSDAGRRAHDEGSRGHADRNDVQAENKGVPVLNGRSRGDLYVEVKVQTPAKLSKRQSELLQELEGTFRVENKPVAAYAAGKVKEIFG